MPNIWLISEKTTESVMNNFFIVPNVKKDTDLSVTKRICSLLTENGRNVYVYIGDEVDFNDVKASAVNEMPADCELVIVIGGDGSFIDASSFAVDNDVPILGINLGKTGFLSEVEPSELSVLNKIFTSEYKINEKMLLGVTVVENDGREYYSERLAVNDIVISHTSFLGVSEFVIYSNEGGIKYRADGVVISTPAGSTAYSLSAGGPVVSHDTDAVIVTPIAPHSIFNRSIVFSDKDVIKVKNLGAESMKISIDGRFFADIGQGAKCTVKVSEKRIKVLTFKENSMFSNLFGKIQVVEDII